MSILWPSFRNDVSAHVSGANPDKAPISKWSAESGEGAVSERYDRIEHKSNRTLRIDGFDVPVEVVEINGFAMFELTAGTNGPRYGDSGHGCRSVVILKIESGDMRCVVNGDINIESAHSVKLIFGGDDERLSLIELLRRAADSIERISTKNGPEEFACLSPLK